MATISFQYRAISDDNTINPIKDLFVFIPRYNINTINIIS